MVRQKWEAARPELGGLPGFAQAFLPKGRSPNVGELWQFKAAAKALRLIAETRGEAFYRGEIAQAIERFAKENNGSITARDFASFRPEWVKPIEKTYRGYTLHEIPPNGQGIAALMALGILGNFDLASHKLDGADSQHLQIEAMKLAFADVYKHCAELSHMEVTPEQLLDDAYLASRAKLIDMKKAQDFGSGNFVKGGTIYLTAADENGMMVSFIQSNYMGFGSGCVEPHYGISLQNRGHGFSLRPGPNQVAPGKRPFHTIIPAFLSKDGEPVMSFGVMGGNMQPQGHLQTVVRMLDYGQNPQAACDAPRWRFNAGFEINVEHQMDKAVVQELGSRGHRMEVINDSYQDFGAGQFIWRAGDPQGRRLRGGVGLAPRRPGCGVLRPGRKPWIPACAGMTDPGVVRREERPREVGTQGRPCAGDLLVRETQAVVPAEAGTQGVHLSPADLLEQIGPLRIALAHEPQLPEPVPLLDALFALDGGLDVRVHFVPDEARHGVPFREAGHEVLAVLPETLHQVRRHADVQRPPLAARKHVDSRLERAHGPT